jgi:hypothetical protein
MPLLKQGTPEEAQMPMVRTFAVDILENLTENLNKSPKAALKTCRHCPE